MNNVDKTFVINLDERQDRLNYITNHLNDVGIHNFERVSSTKINFESDISKIKLAQISCFHSHLKTLRKAYHLNLNNILILEDDCKFINKKLNFTFNDYDILYLGCNRKIYKNENKLIYISDIEKVNENIVKINECGTTHAIMYSRYFIQKVIDLYPSDSLFFQKAFTLDEKYYIYDVFLNWFTQTHDIQKYCVYPILCTQSESFSDIQFCYTNYDEEIQKSWL